MTLTWQPPLTDGESPITAYIVERQDMTSAVDRLTGWTRVDRLRPHIYSYTVPHLAEGHRYLYRIIAENDHGRGPPLETRNPVEAKSPFCKFVFAVTIFTLFEQQQQQQQSSFIKKGG